jgi:cytoskeletal protein CcmA (bactofilin family)
MTFFKPSGNRTPGEKMQKAKKRADTVSTYLGADVSVTGTIAFKDTIRLDGMVKGRIIGDNGTVIIGEKAVIHAEISADVVIIRGEVHGKIHAKHRIEAYSPGRISGDVKAAVITVEPGVVFNGKFEMISQKAPHEIPVSIPKISPPENKIKSETNP